MFITFRCTQSRYFMLLLFPNYHNMNIVTVTKTLICFHRAKYLYKTKKSEMHRLNLKSTNIAFLEEHFKTVNGDENSAGPNPS